MKPDYVPSTIFVRILDLYCLDGLFSYPIRLALRSFRVKKVARLQPVEMKFLVVDFTFLDHRWSFICVDSASADEIAGFSARTCC